MLTRRLLGKGANPVLLVPPSPPGAPHLGSLYTWCLADAVRRASDHATSEGIMPQSWNMASRRLESAYSHDHAAYVEYCDAAVKSALQIIAPFGVGMSDETVLRDDADLIRRHVRSIISNLAERGNVRLVTATEKWCQTCQLPLPPTTRLDRCFQCSSPLEIRTTADWFLRLDRDRVHDRAEAIQWIPTYALRRFRDLHPRYPLIRVGHPNRSLGIPSPLHDSHIIDPRLVAALAPAVLRRLGLRGPIVAIAGLDIQRKWLLTMLAAGPLDALPVAVMNHGILLDENGRKISRYAGASFDDLPAGVEPQVLRAALLCTPLGRDVRLSDLPLVAASRLRKRILNSLRFLRLHDPSGAQDAVDLHAELTPYLARVDDHLDAFDTVRAFNTFREAIAHRLSRFLIPRIRRHGVKPHKPTADHIRLLHQIFYGEDPNQSAADIRPGQSEPTDLPIQPVHRS